MENLEIILSISGTAVGLLATAITFIIKFIKAIKDKNRAQAIQLIKEFAETAVKEVETLKDKNGSDLVSSVKKTIALTKINQLCIEMGIAFNEKEADKQIEDMVAFTKIVNARDKDKGESL